MLPGASRGFIFAPFGNEGEVYTIPMDSVDVEDSDLERWIEENGRGSYFREIPADESISRELHMKYVWALKQGIKCYESDHGCKAKVVAARQSVEECENSPLSIFRRAEEKYRGACVFLFSSSLSGTWVGASPELLLEADGTSSHTISLAGTRPAGCGNNSSNDGWDEKNIEEQRIVTDFIVDSFSDMGMQVVAEGPYTQNAGSVEHLKTDIYAKTALDKPVDCDAVRCRLAPTPALSGFPKGWAINMINLLEFRPRGFYGGYLGLKTSDCSEKVYVNLRSGHYDPLRRAVTLYAGGGITALSDPAAEYEETERKLATLRSLMG